MTPILITLGHRISHRSLSTGKADLFTYCNTTTTDVPATAWWFGQDLALQRYERQPGQSLADFGGLAGPQQNVGFDRRMLFSPHAATALVVALHRERLREAHETGVSLSQVWNITDPVDIFHGTVTGRNTLTSQERQRTSVSSMYAALSEFASGGGVETEEEQAAYLLRLCRAWLNCRS